MNAATYVKDQLESVFNLLNMCVGGMDEEQYNWQPPGCANSPAKSHVHALTALDFFVLRAARRGDMLWPAFAADHGLPRKAQEIWAHEGAIPLPALKEFGQLAQKAAMEYIATIKDDDLDRVIDTQFFGEQSLAFLLQLATTHTVAHAGDMAAIKGVQGVKGLPF